MNNFLIGRGAWQPLDYRAYNATHGTNLIVEASPCRINRRQLEFCPQ